jgi:hypothetical protein
VNSFYSELQWLPPAPKDFSDRLKALGNSSGPLGRELQVLAQHGLNLNQLTKLAKAIALAKTDGRSLDPLVTFGLAVLRNLTTRRYTEPEILGLERDPKVFTLQVRLADIFGDNGMISVLICRPLGSETWEIDTWVMSCRAPGRKVEHMVLREILEHARAAGIRKLIGIYRPTERNKLVVDHYGKLGFNKVREEESGLTEWELFVDPTTDWEASPMNVVTTGFTIAAETPIS